MNDFVFVQYVQTLKHAVGKLANQLKAKALERRETETHLAVLDASLHLDKRVCLSVGPSVKPK